MDKTMSMEARVQKVFEETFANDNFVWDTSLSRDNWERWDSLTHIQLILALEEEFQMNFTTQQILDMQSVSGILAALAGE